MNRVEMCLAAATPAGASVRRVARAGGRARRWRRAALAPARGRAEVRVACSLPARPACSASAA
eukprot:scaffold40578_cov69-Phaeocystis_antarctica.AAC.5